MNLKRAHEILTSSGNIGVHYQDSSVWIESIDDSEQTATVRNLNTNEITRAPLVALFEDSTIEYR